MQSSNSNHADIVLVTVDRELVSLAKAALGSESGPDFTVIESDVAGLANTPRDLGAKVIIVDMDTSRIEEFEGLQKLKRSQQTGCQIIVISSTFSPAAARFLIHLRVADFLVKPLKTSDLVRSCNNALKDNGEGGIVEPNFLAFMPASGGVGATSMAIEAASILNERGKHAGHTTCVVDLNFQHGSCAEYLDLEPRFDITEIENAPERLDRQLLDVMLSKHDSGLAVISAINQPTEMRSFKSALVVRLLDLVSAYFDNVVIDMPRTWFPWTETVISGCDRVFVVADMTVPSIRHSQRLVNAIVEKTGKRSNPGIIVNRMDFRNSGNTVLKAKDVESVLGEHFAGGVPNNYSLVRDAVDRGVQLKEIEANNNVTEGLRKIILPNREQLGTSGKRNGLLSIGRGLFRGKAA